MADFARRFASTKQDWVTPDSLFRRLDARFHFTIDLAADSSNAKCARFFDRQADALRQDWSGHTGWLNPPYGDTKGNRLADWVRKAYDETRLAGLHNKAPCTAVLLIPARTNTNWFHDYCMNAQELMLVCGRPRFVGADHGLPQPLALVVFASRHLSLPPQPVRLSSFVI